MSMESLFAERSVKLPWMMMRRRRDWPSSSMSSSLGLRLRMLVAAVLYLPTEQREEWAWPEGMEPTAAWVYVCSVCARW